jgi:hypothetical protein
MATIPISQIVKVNPGVLSAAGSAVDLNGLILTSGLDIPMGTVKQFASAADVSAYFGSTSNEAIMANIYFNGYTNCTKTPGILYFTQYNTSAVGGFLRSGSFAATTLAQLQALTGILTITVAGTAKTSTTINLSGATSFSNAATIIQAAFTSPGFTVTYDSIKSAFLFSETATGVTSTISFATGTLANGLLLTSALGAVTSQGAAVAVQSTFMDNLVNSITQNWALFTTTFEPVTADKQLFSAWANAQNYRYAYVGFDSDINATVAGSTTTWGYYLTSNQVSSSVPIYGDLTHAAFTLGYAASLDFARLNGRATLAFKSQSGLAPSVSNSSLAAGLEANKYNWYGAYATSNSNFNFLYPGVVSGQFIWLDTFLDQIWLNANLQLSMVNLLLGVGSVPYNDQGYGLVYAATQDPILAAVNFGAIRVGVQLSTSQKAQMQFALGVDVSQAMYAKGYYLQIVPATAAIRIARTSPSMTLYYTDGGSIQKLTLASIEIQ